MGITKMESLEKHILQLENDLLKPEIRQSVEKTGELLAEGFIEFCSSGHIYLYNKDEAVDETTDSPELNWEIKNFEIKQLSEECLLATYKLIKHSDVDEHKKYSNRSSIWKYFYGKWKMIFHQGTLTTEL